MTILTTRHAVAAVTLVLAGTGAFADERSISLMNCRSGVTTILTQSRELTLMAIEHTGVHSGFRLKTFENNTNHCIGTMRISSGQRRGNGFCRNVDPDGDETYVEWTVIDGEGSWSFIGGTGKWQGIRGSGESRSIVTGKAVKKGTYQGCVRITGEYTLPE